MVNNFVSRSVPKLLAQNWFDFHFETLMNMSKFGIIRNDVIFFIEETPMPEQCIPKHIRIYFYFGSLLKVWYQLVVHNRYQNATEGKL